ncbi:MAG TPA: hypothetical protein VLX28_15580, partial [Thermoanaerobaculia bacterium]|nr:hypothetical protein [Thermoanaerobaculia bacterium]
MGEQTSTKTFELWLEAAQKFDYFMTGLTAAIVGYLAPMLQPKRLGWNPQTVELLALILLLAAVLAGLKRIEASVCVLSVGVARLQQGEAAEELYQAMTSGALLSREKGE